jgi:16S rRNA (guanine527-N7)-methyltransferase
MQQADPQLCEKLNHLIAKTDLVVSSDQIAKLVGFVELIDKWNKVYNLTSIRQTDDMLVKHIMDSIIVAPLLHNPDCDKNTYIDVGTGPGLPGIPLAIMHPEYQFVLLDSLGKRVRFMQQVVYALGLDNVTPVQSRVEAYSELNAFTGVISRAFASTKDMLHWCAHLVNSNGRFFALKGQYPRSELAEIGTQFSVEQTHILQVPHLIGERHLVVIKKNEE